MVHQSWLGHLGVLNFFLIWALCGTLSDAHGDSHADADCRIPATSATNPNPIIPGAPGTKQNFTGVVADRLCVDKPDHIGVDGTNMLTSADQHTVHCLVDIAACVASGYCLMQQTVNNEWHCVLNFTSAETLKLKDFFNASRAAHPRTDRVIVDGEWKRGEDGCDDFIVDTTKTIFDNGTMDTTTNTMDGSFTSGSEGVLSFALALILSTIYILV